MAERELIDGAFYWVGGKGNWRIAQYSRGHHAWWLPGISGAIPTLAIPEIGVCLGRDPPEHGLDAEQVAIAVARYLDLPGPK